MLRRSVFAALAVVGVLLAVAPLLGGNGQASACGGFATGMNTFQVQTPDGLRTVLLQVPKTAHGRAPLVLAFHGTGGSGPFMAGYSGLEGVADRSGFLVAYPSAQADPPDQWGLGEDRRGGDDVAVVDAIIAKAVARGCADRTRVYAVGVSNGGGFATRLGCERSDRIAAVVSVAGFYGSLAPCRPDRPVSLLEIHGTADQVVPYDHAAPGGVLGWVRAWAQRDGCRSGPRRSVVAARVVRLDWSACRSGAAVAHLAISAGRHQWPGATPPDPGPPSTISAAVEAWRFLSAHRLSVAQ
jgi:polyhydroxybutyrate depolymerase